jgi:hypothetical protein
MASPINSSSASLLPLKSDTSESSMTESKLPISINKLNGENRESHDATRFEFAKLLKSLPLHTLTPLFFSTQVNFVS